MVDKYVALERLSKLKAAGVLTDAEFAAEKARVLGGEYQSEARPAQPAGKRKWRWGRAALIGAAIATVIEISRYDWVPSANGNAQAATSERLSRCDTAEARDALTSAFEHSAAERLASIKVLDVSNIVERSYDDKKPERICAADVTLNAGRQHTGFRIYPTSSGDNFIVETVDDPGPAPIAVAAENATSVAPTPTASSVTPTVDPDDLDQWAQAARDTIERGDSTATDELAAAAREREGRAQRTGQLPIIDASQAPVYTTEAAARAANPRGTCIVKGISGNGEGWFAEPDYCGTE